MDYLDVTELAGDDVSQEQVDRISHRYYWAREYARGKDVAEVACGTGQGLGCLKAVAASMAAGDISPAMIQRVKAHYGDAFPILPFDATRMPYADQSKDVILLFEALYYLPRAEEFVKECRRVLRPDGMVLISTANKDLFDFNPSPYSHKYYGAVELKELFGSHGFSVDLFAHCPADVPSLKGKILRWVKKTAVAFHLIPKTMKGKKLLKKLVFGKLVKMPHEIPGSFDYQAPPPISRDVADRTHKVIYCAARKS